MKIDLYEQLGYLNTNELWTLMSMLKVPYCTVEDVEKENMETGEKVTVPKFIPRTDYESMKSDIVVAWGKTNRDGRRKLQSWLDKATKTRMKCAPQKNYHNECETSQENESEVNE